MMNERIKMFFYRILAFFLGGTIRLTEIVRSRKLWFCVMAFIMVMVLYIMRRSFGTVSGALQQSLGVKRSLLMLIPAAFSFSPIVGAWLGPMVDRNPVRWLFVGATGAFIGFLGCSLNTHNYPIFLSFGILAAFSSTATYYSISSFAIRPDEYGTTRYFVPEGMSRSLAPVLFSIPAVMMGMKFNVGLVFVGIACAIVLLATVFFFVIRKLPYKENPNAPIIIHKWSKEPDYWANVLVGISFDATAALISASFIFVLTQSGASKELAVILFLSFFCGFNLLGRFFWAEFGFRISTRLGLSLGIAFTSVGLILIPTGFWGACIGFALAGFGGGTGTSNQRCYLGDRYGQEQIMSRTGSMNTGVVPISTLFVIMSGVMFDNLGNYYLVYWILSAITAFASMVFLLEKNIVWVNRKNSKGEDKKRVLRVKV